MAFQKGQSGNPGGRPRKAPSLVKALIEQAHGEYTDGRPYMQAIASSVLAMAVADPDHRIRLDAAKLVMERLDGKVADTTNVNTAGTLRVKVVYERANGKATGTPPAAAESSG